MPTSYRKRAFSYRKNTGRALSSIKKIGVRSIFDIISDQTMSFDHKIDYIRHHYVYYEGNYDLFHDENGNSTETKQMLDEIIKSIINGTLDPSELSVINKEISALRKEKDKEYELKRQKELDKIVLQNKNIKKEKLKEKAKEDLTTANRENALTEKNPYFKVIDAYINSLTKEKQDEVSTWSYKDLKQVAKNWARLNASALLAETPEEEKATKEATAALLKGYRKFAKKEWKDNQS